MFCCHFFTFMPHFLCHSRIILVFTFTETSFFFNHRGLILFAYSSLSVFLFFMSFSFEPVNKKRRYDLYYRKTADRIEFFFPIEMEMGRHRSQRFLFLHCHYQSLLMDVIFIPRARTFLFLLPISSHHFDRLIFTVQPNSNPVDLILSLLSLPLPKTRFAQSIWVKVFFTQRQTLAIYISGCRGSHTV